MPGRLPYVRVGWHFTGSRPRVALVVYSPDRRGRIRERILRTSAASFPPMAIPASTSYSPAGERALFCRGPHIPAPTAAKSILRHAPAHAGPLPLEERFLAPAIVARRRIHLLHWFGQKSRSHSASKPAPPASPSPRPASRLRSPREAHCSQSNR